MPITPTYGVRAQAAALGVQQARAAAPEPAFPAGLVARWTLDDTSAGYVDLISGRVLTAVGTAPTTAAGVIGDAAAFGGAGGLRSGAFPILAIGTAVEAWLRTATTASGVRSAITQDVSGNRAFSVFNQSALFRFNIYNTLGNTVQASSSTIAADTWYHVVALVTAAQEARIYINGVAAGTSTALTGTLHSPSLPLEVGFREFASGVFDYFSGRIDEPAIWQFGPSGDPGAAFWLDRFNAGAGRRP